MEAGRHQEQQKEKEANRVLRALIPFYMDVESLIPQGIERSLPALGTPGSKRKHF